MSGLRFKAGELARVIFSVDHPGDIVEIVAVGSFRARCGTPSDYIVLHATGVFVIQDWRLAKIDPPAEPASLTRETDVEAEA